MDKAWLDYCKSFIPKIKARHKKMLGVDCQLENPRRFTDKLEWLKVYDSTPLKTYCSDKILVRNYVTEKIGKDISIPLIGTYDKFDDIKFECLPNNYVIKTNHGSHTNVIVRNGIIDKVSAKKKFVEWMSKDWSWWGYELHYIPIKRKICIEQFMENNGTELNDYKFYCFNGVPTMCQVIGNRSSHETITHYDMNWKKQSMYDQKGYDTPDCKKPVTFDIMQCYARKLSHDFKFVRCDFYEINGNVYFGELTFIPGAAYLLYVNPQSDLLIGNMLKL